MIANLIFMSGRYTEFKEDESRQYYFDRDTNFIYVVYEAKNGDEFIREIPDDSPAYGEIFAEYVKAIGEKYIIKMEVAAEEVNQYEVEKMIKNQLKNNMVVTKMEIERDK